MDDDAAYPLPRPDHGTIYITELARGDWAASWQDEPGFDGIEDVEGTLVEVVAWARSKRCPVKLVWHPGAETYLPLPDEGLPSVPSLRRQALDSVSAPLRSMTEGPGWVGGGGQQGREET